MRALDEKILHPHNTFTKQYSKIKDFKEDNASAAFVASAASAIPNPTTHGAPIRART